jgi:hypothetical protein
LDEVSWYDVWCYVSCSETFEKDPVTALVESLKRHGVSAEVLQEALAEVAQR